MNARKDKLVELFGRYIDLDLHLYVGHEIQCDVFDKMKEVAREAYDIVAPRVDAVVDYFDLLPCGEWKKSVEFAALNRYCIVRQSFREIGREVPKCRPTLLNNHCMGFEYTKGEDDGYPDLGWFSIPRDILMADTDDEAKKIVLGKACVVVATKTFELDCLLHKETEVKDKLDNLNMLIGGKVEA